MVGFRTTPFIIGLEEEIDGPGKEKWLDLAKNDPRAFWGAIESKKFPFDKNYAEEVMLVACEAYPSVAFSDLKYYRNQPWIENVLMTTLEKNPVFSSDYAFENYKLYKKEPWAKDVLRFAGTHDLESLKFLAKYKDEPWVKDVYLAGVRKDASIAVQHFDSIKDQPWAKEAAIFIAQMSPKSAFENFGLFKDQPWAKEVLLTAKENSNDPWIAFHKAEFYEDQPWASEIMGLETGESLRVSNGSDSYWAMEYFPYYKNQPWAKDKIMEAAKVDLYGAAYSVKAYGDQPWAKEIIDSMVDANPEDAAKAVFVNLEAFQEQTWIKDIVNRLVTESVNGVYMTVGYYDSYKDKPWAKEVYETATSKENLVRLAKTVPWKIDTYKEQLSELPWSEEIIAISKDKETIINLAKEKPYTLYGHHELYADQPWYKDLIKIILQEDPIKSFYISDSLADKTWAHEFYEPAYKVLAQDPKGNQQTYLHIIESMNRLHEEEGAKRYNLLEGASVENLYDMMGYGYAELAGGLGAQEEDGGDEIYTSTYHQVFNRILSSVEKEGSEEDQNAQGSALGRFLLQDRQEEMLATFFKGVVEFSRTDDLMNALTSSEQQALISKALNYTVDNRDLTQAISFSQMFNQIEHSNIQDMIRQAMIDKMNDPQTDLEAKNLIGLMGRWHLDKSKTAHKNKEFKEIFSDSKYAFEHQETIKLDKLISPDGVSRQMTVFYKGKDGEYHHGVFLNEIEKNGYKKNENQGSDGYDVYTKSYRAKTIELYVVKPRSKDDNSAIHQIKKKLENQNASIDLFVHRGHSYFASQSAEDCLGKGNVAPSPGLVIDGGCGGMSRVNNILSKTPEAQVISTPATGKGEDNNRIFLATNESILKGQAGSEIDWRNIENASQAHDYIFPHENISALFIKAYNNLNQAMEPNIQLIQQQSR